MLGTHLFIVAGIWATSFTALIPHDVETGDRGAKDLLESFGARGASEHGGLQIEVGGGPQSSVYDVACVGYDRGVIVERQEPGGYRGSGAVGCDLHRESLPCI